MVENVVIPEFTSGWSTIIWTILTVVMPLAVGLVTRPNTAPAVKSFLLIVLSAINGYLSEALETGLSYNWTDGTIQFVVSLVMALAIHFGVWGPLGATRAVQNAGTPRDQRIAA